MLFDLSLWSRADKSCSTMCLAPLPPRNWLLSLSPQSFCSWSLFTIALILLLTHLCSPLLPGLDKLQGQLAMQNFHYFGLQRVKGHFCFKMYHDSGSLLARVSCSIWLYFWLTQSLWFWLDLTHSGFLWLFLAHSGSLSSSLRRSLAHKAHARFTTW